MVFEGASEPEADCNENAFPEGWWGDGIWDNGDYTYEGNAIYLDCPEFGFDGGDCAGSLTQDLSNLLLVHIR